MVENHTAFSLSACEVGPAFVVGNVVWRYFNESYKLKPRDRVGPIFVYHNTHWVGWEDEPGDVGIGIQVDHGPVDPPAAPYLSFVNNIVLASDWARDDPGPAGIDRFEHNCWHTSAPDRLLRIEGEAHADLGAYRIATGDEVGSVQGEPRFVDAAAADFHLADDSPCRARGLPVPGINDATPDAPPDMGAFFDGVVEPMPGDPEDPGDTGDGDPDEPPDGTDTGAGTGGDTDGGGGPTEDPSMHGEDPGCGCRSRRAGLPGLLSMMLAGALRGRRWITVGSGSRSRPALTRRRVVADPGNGGRGGRFPRGARGRWGWARRARAGSGRLRGCRR